MIHELQYTSAERTLQVGVKGFGPVVATRGMPAALEERLVALSGYRHLFAGHHDRAQQNPVNYSHLVVSAAGKAYHVLSRVADAGFDYSRRSNKLAHHLALESTDLTIGGPAALLSTSGVVATQFDGNPRWLDHGRKLPVADVKPAICQAWQRATGDAGWGGILAQTALAAKAVPVVILYKTGFDPLPLIAESLALLPANRRWQISFSTFYTKLPPGVECLWRCVPADDPEAAFVSRAPNVRTLDLTKPLGKPPASPWVDAARTGKLPIVQPPRAPQRQLVLAGEKPGKNRAGKPPVIDPESLGIEPLAGEDWFSFDTVPVSFTALEQPEVNSQRRWRIVGGAAAGVAAFITIIAITSSMLTKDVSSVVVPDEDRRADIRQPAIPKKSAIADEQSKYPNNVHQSLTNIANNEPFAVSPASEPVKEAPKATKLVELDSQHAVGPSTSEKPVTSKIEPSQLVREPVVFVPRRTAHPLDAIRRTRAIYHGLKLPVAPVNLSPLEVSSEKRDWTSLVDLPGVKATPVKLSLEPPASGRKLTLVEESRDGEAGWTVVGKTGSPAGDDELARLRIAEERLMFRWLKVNRGMKPEQLSQSTLTLTINEQSETVRLQSAIPLAEGVVSWPGAQSEPVALSSWHSTARWQVTLDGAWIESLLPTPPQATLAPGSRAIIRVPVSIRPPMALEFNVRASDREPHFLSFSYELTGDLIDPEGRAGVWRSTVNEKEIRAAADLARRTRDEVAERLRNAKKDAELQRLSVEQQYWQELAERYQITLDWLASDAPQDLKVLWLVKIQNELR